MLWSSSNYFWPCCLVQKNKYALELIQLFLTLLSCTNMLWSSSNYFLQNINYTTCCLGRYLYRFLSSICVTPTAPMYFLITFFSFQASSVMKFSSDILNSSLPFLSSPFCPVILSFLMKFSYSSCYYSFHYVILPIIMECSFSYCNSSFHISSPFNPVTFPSNFPWTYVFLPGLLSSSLDFSHPPGLVSSSLD